MPGQRRYTDRSRQRRGHRPTSGLDPSSSNHRAERPARTQQLVVSGKYADGSVRDLTAFVEASLENAALANLDTDLFLSPKQNGATNLVIKAGGQMVKVPVVVKDMEKPQPVTFRNDLIASLNVGGCNAGACHGTPSGKNGFKLSLRGYDPDAVHPADAMSWAAPDRNGPTP
jgi:hypothetical protein